MSTDFDFNDVRNTISMNMEPRSQEEYSEFDQPTSGRVGLSLMPICSGEVFKKLVNYPVIVECWEKKKYGRVKREWEKKFTKAERNKIARYYGRFYRWHLVSGTPKRVSLRLSTLQLLKKAAEFFATI